MGIAEGKVLSASLILFIYISTSIVRDILLYRDFWITLYIIVAIRMTTFNIFMYNFLNVCIQGDPKVPVQKDISNN